MRAGQPAKHQIISSMLIQIKYGLTRGPKMSSGSLIFTVISSVPNL